MEHHGPSSHITAYNRRMRHIIEHNLIEQNIAEYNGASWDHIEHHGIHGTSRIIVDYNGILMHLRKDNGTLMGYDYRQPYCIFTTCGNAHYIFYTIYLTIFILRASQLPGAILAPQNDTRTIRGSMVPRQHMCSVLHRMGVWEASFT